MDLVSGLQKLERHLALTAERVVVVKAELEDLLFRAQKIASATRSNRKDNDAAYGQDLQNFRGKLRTFRINVEALPGLLSAMERQAARDPAAAKSALEVMRGAARVANEIKNLHDMALLAHQHIRATNHKILAWYVAQEISEMALKVMSLPTHANRIVMACATAPGPDLP